MMFNTNKVSARTLGLSALVAIGLAGCKSAPPVTDQSLQQSIQTQLASDSAIAGQPVTVAVQNGVATLNGQVANDAQRTIAARDAAGVAGVKQVTNALLVQSASATAMTAPPPIEPVKPSAGTAVASTASEARAAREQARRDREAQERLDRQRAHETAPVERTPPPVQQSYTPAPPPPPAAPAAPTFRNVTIAAGDALPVRVTQTLDSATTQEGTPFSGVLASDIVVDGVVAVPAGTAVSGQVDTVHEAGHFKGSSLLTVSLNSLTRRGERVSLSTEPYTVEGKGRGKNTLAKSGIGAAGGAILGGIFGGGKGAAIGAGVGGAGGAGINAVTRGEQVQIPSETVVRFRLTSPVTLKVRAEGERSRGDQNLQPR